MKNKWFNAVQIGAVYVGTVVGAGFATGKEIVEFFTRFGSAGILGIIAAGILFSWLGVKMLLISSRIGAHSYIEFNEYIFGKAVGTIVNVLMMLVLLGVTSVMLSGAGAVFREQLGMSGQFGILLTIFLAVAVMLIGIKGLFGVNMFVVPMMLIFTAVMAGNVIFDQEFWYNLSKLAGEGGGLGWAVSPFTYSAFNLAMAQAVLVPLAREVRDEETLKLGGAIGGAALGFILLMSHIALSVLPDVTAYEIPMAQVMRSYMNSIYWIFIIIIYGEIFTSVIGNMFGLYSQMSKSFLHIPRIWFLAAIIMPTYLISLLGYGSLISFLYPLFGYVSLGLLILLMFRRIPEKRPY